MQTPSQPPHTVDALLRVIEVRDAEVVLLKLMIDKRIKAPPAILQLHIELRGTKPKVWRRVLVPETITLVIQAAFGWGHSHLHEFIAGDGERYGTPDPMYDAPGSITSENTRLTTALRKATLNYVYDFGDYWEHRINLIRTHDGHPDRDGRRRCAANRFGLRPPRFAA